VLETLVGDQVMAGFIAHPAGSTEVQVEAITKPLSIAAADEDVAFTDEKRKISENIEDQWSTLSDQPLQSCEAWVCGQESCDDSC